MKKTNVMVLLFGFLIFKAQMASAGQITNGFTSAATSFKKGVSNLVFKAKTKLGLTSKDKQSEFETKKLNTKLAKHMKKFEKLEEEESVLRSSPIIQKINTLSKQISKDIDENPYKANVKYDKNGIGRDVLDHEATPENIKKNKAELDRIGLDKDQKTIQKRYHEIGQEKRALKDKMLMANSEFDKKLRSINQR